MGRPKRLAAAVVAGWLMLIPAALATTSGHSFLSVAAAFTDPSALPGAGDLLAALRRAQAAPEEYGAGGTLPESDTLSPELLAALAGPTTGNGFGTGAGPLATVPPGPLGIPGVMLDAYIRAEQTLAVSHPQCGLHWSVLASIGRIESAHARGGAVDAQGTTVRAILGPQLSGGPGIAAIRDSDGGLLDGDAVWDRAVGPMQFIPTTWARYAVDGNADGTASPHNIYDATLAAGHYLCAGGGDLRDPVALAQAIFRYNHSDAYVANVLSWAAAYAAGVTPLPSSSAPIDEPVTEQPPGTTPPTTTPPGTTTTPTSTTTSTSTSTTTSTTTPTCPTTPTSTGSSTSPTSPPPSSCQTTTSPTSSSAGTSSESTATQSPPASQPGGSSSASSSQSSTESSVAQTPTSSTESATSSGGASSTTTSLPPT